MPLFFSLCSHVLCWSGTPAGLHMWRLGSILKQSCGVLSRLLAATSLALGVCAACICHWRHHGTRKVLGPLTAHRGGSGWETGTIVETSTLQEGCERGRGGEDKKDGDIAGEHGGVIGRSQVAGHRCGMWVKIGWPSARNADLQKRSQTTVTASRCRPVISLARPPGLRLGRFGPSGRRSLRDSAAPRTQEGRCC